MFQELQEWIDQKREDLYATAETRHEYLCADAILSSLEDFINDKGAKHGTAINIDSE